MAEKDAKSFNVLRCIELADQDEEEGDEGADEEWHFEFCEVVSPQLLNQQVEYYQGEQGEKAENEEDPLYISVSSRVIFLLAKVQAVAFVGFQENGEL